MAKKRPVIHVVSVSGGKDSAATLDLALSCRAKELVYPIFCDTGHEHAAVYEYLDYLEAFYQIKIHRLKADFAEEIANKRRFIARDTRTKREYSTRQVFDAEGKAVFKLDARGSLVLDGKGRPMAKTVKVGGGRKVRWTNKAKRRALAVLYPTGNPYLDLCMWKGRFPSRTAQFCTEHLKRNIAVKAQLDLVDLGYRVISWQGVRRDESENRKNAKKFETVGSGIYAYRPIAYWTALDVFAHCAAKGLKPNPLYLQGMGRVGCMPCINANKPELKAIGIRFPEEISRVANWETLVAACSKRGGATFIPAPWRGKKIANSVAHAIANDIYSVVRWANTKRGGRELAPRVETDAPSACASSYGLCE